MPRYKPRVTITIPEAAIRLGVNPRTVRRWIESGKLPAYRLYGQGYVRINADDVEALLVPVTV
jgi:excisionase family DNA binding protein